MQLQVEKKEKNQVILKVEVEKEQVADALEKAFKKVVKQVNVPGFRKGKVPRPIFEKRFGKEALYKDAIDILLPKAYEEAIKEAGLEPIDQPEIDIEQFAKDEEFKFIATIQVKPEVVLGAYKGLEIEKKEFAVKEEDIEKELQNLQNRHAELEILSEGILENGDIAVIDYEGFVDNNAFPGGKGEKYNLEIGSNTFIPGFEEQLIGMAKGEEKEITVTFPENYHSADLAGKEAVFKVKLNDIKRKKLPVLDDEFAKDLDFETLAELKEDIKNKLIEKAKKEEEDYLSQQVVEKATENATIDVPKVMIEHELDYMLKNFDFQLRNQGLNLELYQQFTGNDLEGLKAEWYDNAEKSVRTQLVLEKIAKEEKIEITPAELEEEYQRLAELYKRSIEEIRQIFGNEKGEASLLSELRNKKTINFLVENRQK